MAQQVITKLVCDITGDEAVESIDFAVSTTRYHIDLSDVKAKEFHDALLPYIAAAQVVGKSSRASKNGARSTDAAQIRAWAKEQGLDVPERGRIPATLRERYQAAQG